MVCLHCNGKTRVINSRAQRRANQIWRRRQCLVCQAVFTTNELADYAHNWLVLGVSGRPRPFLRDKLFLSLYRSFQHRPTAIRDAAALADIVMQRLRQQVQAGSIEVQQIRQTVQVALNRFDKPASVHYMALHTD